MSRISTAALLERAEARAANRMENEWGADEVRGAADLDEALADAQHYAEQRRAAAEVIRRSAVYQRGNGQSFWRDFIHQNNSNAGVNTRLRRHAEQVADLAMLEGRAASSSAFAGLVVPTYLLDHLSPGLRAAWPLTQAIGEQLPVGPDGLSGGGMSVQIAKVTTNSTGSPQTAENTVPASTDPATTMLTIPVNTIPATIAVSLQMVDRGNKDELITRELYGALNAEVERQVIVGSGAGGQATGLLTAAGTSGVTYTNAAPTGITALPKIGATLTASTNAFLRGTPDVIASHSRFWYWLGTVGEVVEPPLDFGTMTLGADLVGSTAFPTNLGAGTNETRLIAFPRAAVYVGYTDPILDINVEVAGTGGNLTATIVAHRYLAVAVIWPTAVAILSGTGMQAIAT